MAGEKAGSGKKRKKSDLVATAGLIVIFILYMVPFYMVVINSLKQKRDISKSPFSWLYTIKGLSFDNFVKAFVQDVYKRQDSHPPESPHDRHF